MFRGRMVFLACPFGWMRSVNKFFLTLLVTLICFQLALIHHQLCVLLKVPVGNCNSIYRNEKYKVVKLHLVGTQNIAKTWAERQLCFSVFGLQWFQLRTSRGKLWAFCTRSGFYRTFMEAEGDSGLLLDWSSTFCCFHHGALCKWVYSCGAVSVGRNIS